MQGTLAGTVAVVTGGGRGLGRAFTTALAYEEARVAVIDEVGRLDQTIQAERASGSAQTFHAIAVDAESIAGTLEQIEREFGPVDLLVNNTSSLSEIGPLAESDPEEWWQAFELNLRAPMLWTRAVLPGMIERGRGRIINVASSAGTVAIPYMSAYIASKTALIRFTEVVAQEVKAQGIRIFAIEPGTTHTALAMYALESPTGRRWIPWYRNIFDAQDDALPEYSAELIVRLARGDADVLTGRFISRDDNLDEIVRQAKKAIENEWGVLRIRGR